MTRQVYITHIAAFLPNEPVGNDAMESVLGQIGNRPSRARKLILRSNQIQSRYYAIDPETGKTTHSNAEMTAEAVRQLGKQGCNINSIELLACGTTLPDQLMPNHALMVHGELGIPPCEAIATAGICLSGVMSLKYGYLSILAGQTKNCVATGSENASAIMRGSNFSEETLSQAELLTKPAEIAFEKDFLRWMLSDGAGAVWLSDTPNNAGNSLRIDWIFQRSYAGKLDTCMYAGAEKDEDGSLKGWREYLPQEWLEQSIFAIKQDVKLLNDKIIEYTVTKPLQELMTQGRLDPREIGWFLPHYSSCFFRDKVHKGMQVAEFDIPQEKWFTNLSSKGNTGSASIYIILEELFNSGRLKKGETILCYIPESGRFSTAFMHLTVV
ncbi:MAG: beta-ketoacyl-ACP synthase III [Proteobacteria bacterium]|nr:StlD/DarB family beta-ketosynthase [Desulfocapsa sp.]MBU3943736.1 beta-ketoacyl-ACP synthase III [Pseudomonadota bacterium]MCG2744829.1 beta-ketoacyl-ACP synthase III [Desulfobacteraceae bacterium]MBU3983218.1 beta-ketoacyl-ACP synthase III [Pseudomonadota bacterium]MBU4029271.1 beta-ketoacyl-ACP synthase III [Pseudomonadota bacterium]